MSRSRPFVKASEVLRRLAAIEKEGVDFYQGLYEGAESPWIRDFAKMMVRAEGRHHSRFLEYADRAERRFYEEDDVLFEPLPEEIRRILATMVFAPKERVKRSAPYATDEQALQVALRAEASLAMLLVQLRGYVPAPQRRYIDRVIKEEEQHQDFLKELLTKRRNKASRAEA